MRLLKKIKEYLKFNNVKFILKEKLAEDYEKGIKDIKETSKIKNLVFFVLGMVMTCIVQFIIYKIHPSNFTGEKLEQYLIEQICEEYGFNQKEKVHLQNISVENNGVLEESNTLFITGKYEDQCTFIAIFSKGNRGFTDFLFSTNPQYKLVNKYYSEDVSKFELYFAAFKSVDLDGDGKNEVVINLDSEYADYAPRFTLVFKGQEDAWALLEPDLSALEYKVSNYGKDYDIVLKSNIMKEGDKESIKIYGFYNNGEVWFCRNEFYNYYDFCYCIPLWKQGQSMPEIDTFAYLMFRIDRNLNKLVLERNWNQGDVLISQFLTDNEIYEHMGYRTETHIFYDPILQ